MKHFSTALVIAMTTGMLLAAETKKAVLPGTDDLSRYVATKAPPGSQTTLRDASGREDMVRDSSTTEIRQSPLDKERSLK